MKFVNEGRTVYEYHVEYEPPLDSTRLKKKVMRDIMRDKAYTFDGTMLFLSDKVNGDVRKIFKFYSQLFQCRNFHDFPVFFCSFVLAPRVRNSESQHPRTIACDGNICEKEGRQRPNSVF